MEDVLGGRTRPLALRCSQIGTHASPVKRTLVVKAIGLPEITVRGLVFELFGNLLARELGIATPAPALVEIDADAAQALNAGLRRHELRIQPGLAVGSTYLQGLLPIVGALSDEAFGEASTLFGFDLAVQNPDRRLSNPNCALHDDHILAYDFEMCFSFLLAIGSTTEAWEVSKHGLAPGHAMYPYLHRRTPVWSTLLTALRALNEGRLDELVAYLPDTWCDDMARVRAHLLSLVERSLNFRESSRSVLHDEESNPVHVLCTSLCARSRGG